MVFQEFWALNFIFKINLFCRFNNISTPWNLINKFISTKGACPVQKWAWCPRPLHNVNFDEFLSGFILNYFHGVFVTGVFVTKTFLIFYWKSLVNIKSMLNSSLFPVSKPVFRYLISKLKCFLMNNQGFL